MTVDVAALRARLDREFAIVPTRPELPALSYGEGFALLDAIARVEALHRPSTDHGEDFDPYCVGCWEAGGMDGAPSWPCPTMRALDPS